MGVFQVLTKVKKVKVPSGKRIIVISDIHGNYNYLKGLLEKINLSLNDIVFIVGDILEKGKESLKTLRYIMELSNKFDVHVLMGNVDAWRLINFDNDTQEGLEHFIESLSFFTGGLAKDMCDELNIRLTDVSQVLQAKEKMREHFKKELEFVRQLPTIIETQKFIFVHGGVPTDDVSSLEGTDAIPYLKNDNFMGKGFSFNKYVVVGHWGTSLYNDKIYCLNPIIDKTRKIISIDGGCSINFAGQLNALLINDINSEDFSFEYFDDFPKEVALTTQAASETSINISFFDDIINIIESKDDVSFVEHSSSGYKLWTINELIFERDGKVHLDGFSDYKLQVKAGNELSIVRNTSIGYYVKHKGVCGWYLGEFEQ